MAHGNRKYFHACVSPGIVPLVNDDSFSSLSSFLLCTTRSVFKDSTDSCAYLQSLLPCSFYAAPFLEPYLADTIHLGVLEL